LTVISGIASLSPRCGVARAEAPPFAGHTPAMEFLVDKIRAAKNNADFFDSMRRG
jgi:transcription termination factor Rho